MEIKTNSTRVIYNGETTTANAKYYIEYETDGKELKRVNASVNKVEEVEFPMEEGMQKRECATCGATETKSIAKTGHKFGAWFTTTQPTLSLIHI